MVQQYAGEVFELVTDDGDIIEAKVWSIIGNDYTQEETYLVLSPVDQLEETNEGGLLDVFFLQVVPGGEPTEVYGDKHDFLIDVLLSLLKNEGE